MRMFMTKTFLLVALMFVSVLFGMQQANLGIQNMKGFNDANFKGAFTVQENENGEIQASILGNKVSSHDLQQKKEKLEGMKAYNFFSSMGKKLSGGLSAATEKMIHFLTDLVKGI
ncbi:YqxA family protein [Bacillus sp. FJAT-29790]|uniref:YqxA family protein n=1 Tax=Bacillus sp. FJAT-29790 TaxID=1895002 RepID=UPI001C246C87|nr:YqxA family protein [Bacillus sp. FJAT-29790]MBU8879453.1 YqxA family protein [Bacillus sp. FJAT-29790]